MPTQIVSRDDLATMERLWEATVADSLARALRERSDDSRLILADLLEEHSESDPTYLPTARALRWAVENRKLVHCHDFTVQNCRYPFEWFNVKAFSNLRYTANLLDFDVYDEFPSRYRRSPTGRMALNRVSFKTVQEAYLELAFALGY